MCKASIIVPVYNASKTLNRCVDSILKQDFRDYELILVDDGSKDESAKIASAYAQADARIRLIQKKNGGVSSARNRGLAEAKGLYILFVDSDDWLPMEALKLLVREIEQKDTDLVIGDFFRVFEGKISQKGSIAEEGVITRDQYAEAMLKSPADLYFGVLWNKLYKRDLIEQYHVRMDESVSYGEDMIFNLEYLLHASTIAVLKLPVYYYIRMPGSLIEQNISLPKIINMKRTVIRYYDRFYKKILDEETYQERRMVILSYYLAFSTDALTLPWVGGSKDLGKERGADVPFDDTLLDSSIAWKYLTDQLTCRYLETISIRHGISVSETRILYLLWKLGRPCSLGEICSYSGMNRINVTMLLVRMTSSGLINRAVREDKKKPEGYIFSAPDFSLEFRQMENDYRAVCLDGLSEEEKQTYRVVSQKVLDNIRKRVALREERP